MGTQMSRLILSHIIKYYREYYGLSPQLILDLSNLLLLPNTQYSISYTIEYYWPSLQLILYLSNLLLVPKTQYSIYGTIKYYWLITVGD